MRNGTSHMKRKKTDYGIVSFLRCAENSACRGRKPARSRRLSLKRLPEAIMREKRQDEICWRNPSAASLTQRCLLDPHRDPHGKMSGWKQWNKQAAASSFLDKKLPKSLVQQGLEGSTAVGKDEVGSSNLPSSSRTTPEIFGFRVFSFDFCNFWNRCSFADFR